MVTLALVAGLLTVLALQAVEPNPAGRSLEPEPAFSFGQPIATATPSTEAEPAAVDVPARSEQRMLAVGSEPGVIWRAIEGSCTEGTPPLIERSADGGETWADVTPNYRDVRQVLTLEPFAGNQAEAVFVTGDNCEIVGLRTFTQGRFWEPYAEVLAEATYVSPENAALIVTPDAEIEAPCPEPRDVHDVDGQLSLICVGDLRQLTDGIWSARGYSNIVALSMGSQGFPVVAWRAPSCTGLAIATAVSPTLSPDDCLEVREPAAPTAIATERNENWIWNADMVLTVTIAEQ